MTTRVEVRAGERIGQNTLIREVPRPERGQTGQYWLVRCEGCQTERVVPLGRLRFAAARGKDVLCKGCTTARRDHEGRPRSPAEVGDRFGPYTLVSFEGMSRTGQRWQVRCDCGREWVRPLAQLRICARAEQRGCPGCARASREERKRMTMQRIFQNLGHYVDIDRDLPERW